MLVISLRAIIYQLFPTTFSFKRTDLFIERRCKEKKIFIYLYILFFFFFLRLIYVNKKFHKYRFRMRNPIPPIVFNLCVEFSIVIIIITNNESIFLFCILFSGNDI